MFYISYFLWFMVKWYHLKLFFILENLKDEVNSIDKLYVKAAIQRFNLIGILTFVIFLNDLLVVNEVDVLPSIYCLIVYKFFFDNETVKFLNLLILWTFISDFKKSFSNFIILIVGPVSLIRFNNYIFSSYIEKNFCFR